jgi:hypothetical protein
MGQGQRDPAARRGSPEGDLTLEQALELIGRKFLAQGI